MFALDIRGHLNSLRLAESKALWPLFEAVVNSIQSIEDSPNRDNGKITIFAQREDQDPSNIFDIATANRLAKNWTSRLNTVDFSVHAGNLYGMGLPYLQLYYINFHIKNRGVGTPTMVAPTPLLPYQNSLVLDNSAFDLKELAPFGFSGHIIITCTYSGATIGSISRATSSVVSEQFVLSYFFKHQSFHRASSNC